MATRNDQGNSYEKQVAKVIMMKKYMLMIVICVLCFCMTIMTGCGSNQGTNSDSNQTDSDSNQTESAEEVIEYDDPDIDEYVNGMTLDDAKYHYETIFIMKGDRFYPLMPTIDHKSVGTPNTDISITNDGLEIVEPRYAKCELHAITKDTKLVEVDKKKPNDGCLRLSGESGWTIPFDFTCTYDDYIAGNESEYGVIKEGGSSSLNGRVMSINGTPLESQAIEDTVKSIWEYKEKHNPDAACEEIEKIDWNKIYGNTDLKPVEINTGYHGSGDPHGSGFFACAAAILDAPEGAEYEIAYRTENSVDTKTEKAVANYKYYNLPSDVRAIEEPEYYENEYIDTEEGYSIIDTDSFKPGVYKYGDNLLFEVK